MVVQDGRAAGVAMKGRDGVVDADVVVLALGPWCAGSWRQRLWARPARWWSAGAAAEWPRWRRRSWSPLSGAGGGGEQREGDGGAELVRRRERGVGHGHGEGAEGHGGGQGEGREGDCTESRCGKEERKGKERRKKTLVTEKKRKT